MLKFLSTLKILVFGIACTTCLADLPLSVEDLLTESNETRLEFGINYTNVESRLVNSRFDLVQTGSENFVLLPVDISNQRQSSDIFATTLGIRYGFSSRLETYTRLTATASETRIENENAEPTSTSSQQWNELVIGINYLISEDNKTPALLGFVEVSAVENTANDESDFVYAKTTQIGFTTYRALDPVVLSLTAGLRFSSSRKIGGLTVDPGELFFINPSLGFAINNVVTATGGLQLSLRGRDKIQDSLSNTSQTKTNLNLGLGYAASNNLTLNFSFRADMSGDTGEMDPKNRTAA